jgi:hypothetical protein
MPHWRSSRCANRSQSQTQTPAPFPEPSRPFLLDQSAEPLARMVESSNHRETGYRDQMGSGGFSAVLALAISVLRQPAEGQRRDSDSHPFSGDREFPLGRAEDPRGTAEARLRGLQTHGCQISSTDAAYWPIIEKRSSLLISLLCQV